MIKNQIKMQFGTGDIGINSGIYHDDDKNIGVIVFYNQEPRKIGSLGDIKAGTEVDIDDFPIIMTFPKKESIDVVIESLLSVKKGME